MTVAIPPFLDRRPLVFTYTNLNTYDKICPHQMYRRYIVKDIPYVETEPMRLGTRVHDAFELRIAGNKPLPVEFQQWEGFAKPFEGREAKCEMKLAITAKGQTCGYFDATAWLRVRVDIVLMKENIVFIADLKTGNSKYEDPYEIALGALLLKAKYPALTVAKGNYLWLKENRVGQIHDLSDFRATWVKTQSIVQKVETDRANSDFEKRRSGLCGFCDVLDCEFNRKEK